MPQHDHSIQFHCLEVHQPIGTFYIAVMDAHDVQKICFFDVRRRIDEQRDVERYLGIQRPLNPKRVEDLRRYVRTYDASFPTSVIIAVDERCVSIDENANTMTLSPYYGEGTDDDPIIDVSHIARVLDGQHRIDGLYGLPDDEEFDLLVTIFVGIDIADQAHIFSTVNLEQTKVNKSLAYDLFALAKTRSPQRTCHDIAITLDRESDSPLYEKIKRLGVATPGRYKETITQANFVESLMRHISRKPNEDRDALLRGQKLRLATSDELQKMPFRNMFITNDDDLIADIVWNFFGAVARRWPEAWETVGRGNMLNKTNGFRALMRYLRPAFLHLMKDFNSTVTEEQFFGLFGTVNADSDYFSTDNFPAGTSGEAALYRFLMQQTDVRATAG